MTKISLALRLAIKVCDSPCGRFAAFDEFRPSHLTYHRQHGFPFVGLRGHSIARKHSCH
jgi:hypothetical protein